MVQWYFKVVRKKKELVIDFNCELKNNKLLKRFLFGFI